MGELLESRRKESDERLATLRKALADSAALIAGKACVYVTGSFARGEASTFSDLDLFIVGGGTSEKRALRKLDEICLKADLIEQTRELGIPEFSGDGEYLEHYTTGELVKSLGTQEDDAANTFTARLLLLLESRALIGDDVYEDTISDVVGAYWKDYEGHKTEFMPAFLANDILRLWRTFCVNYEARTLKEPEEKRAKRKLKNFKLKHSRLLTCYSALIYLLDVHRRNGTVSTQDIRDMVRRTPTQRLEWLKLQPGTEGVGSKVDRLLESYEGFLAATDKHEDELVQQFMHPEKSKELSRHAYTLGDLVVELLQTLGEKSRFYRLLIV